HRAITASEWRGYRSDLNATNLLSQISTASAPPLGPLARKTNEKRRDDWAKATGPPADDRQYDVLIEAIGADSIIHLHGWRISLNRRRPVRQDSRHSLRRARRHKRYWVQNGLEH